LLQEIKSKQLNKILPLSQNKRTNLTTACMSIHNFTDVVFM
jgi:hypothetical protein